MGNYYCDELLNSIISDSIGAASISNGMWHNMTFTLTPYRGTVADALVYGKAETLSEAVAYHRQKLNESFDNRWATEVRERYTLEPKFSVWSLIFTAVLIAVYFGVDIVSHKMTFRVFAIDCFAVFGALCVGVLGRELIEFVFRLFKPLK